jgi:hypothetical protein
MNKKKERTPHELAEDAQKFLEAIADQMKRLEIQPGLVFSLFGYFARSMVDYKVDEEGVDRDQITIAVLKDFTNGLGVKGGFVEMRGEMAEQVKAQFERQHDDKPLQ